MKTSCKRLKVSLASGVKNFGSASLTLNLDEVPLYNNFLDLGVFWDLDVFGLLFFLTF